MPLHLLEDKSRLTGVPRKSLCQKLLKKCSAPISADHICPLSELTSAARRAGKGGRGERQAGYRRPRAPWTRPAPRRPSGWRRRPAWSRRPPCTLPGGRQADRPGGRQAGGPTGREAGRPRGRQAGRLDLATCPVAALGPAGLTAGPAGPARPGDGSPPDAVACPAGLRGGGRAAPAADLAAGAAAREDHRGALHEAPLADLGRQNLTTAIGRSPRRVA